MKLKPIYNWISPLAIVLATFHMIFMGYKGWNSLFNYAKYKGQPSPTFTTSMFSLGVVAVHIFLAIAGTKKRTSRNSRVEKHSATESAFTKYALVSGTGTSGATGHESFKDDA